MIGIKKSIFCRTILLISFTGLVSCDDFSIYNKITNQVVFQTASEFIRTSECGSLYHKTPAYLVISEPLYTCEDSITSPPISTLESFSSMLKAKFALLADLVFGIDLTAKIQEDTPWVLITALEENGACDLQKKLKNAEEAGYSAVLLASDRNMKEVQNILQKNLLGNEQQQTFLDFHVINPWDIRVLSNFTYSDNSNFGIGNPPRRMGNNVCEEFYSGTKLDVQKALLHDWVNGWLDGIIDYNFSWINRYTNLNKINWATVKSKAFNFLGYLLISMFLVGPMVFICYLSYKDKQKQQGFFYYRYQPSFHEDEQDDEPGPPPPPPGPSARELAQVRQHRLRLGMSPDERLTVANVTSAFRKKALEVHPDKHPEDAFERQNKLFKLLQASKEYLMKICEDTKHEE